MHKETQHIVFLTPGFAESEEDSTTIPALQVFLKSMRKALPDSRMTLLSFQFPFTGKSYDWHGIRVVPLNGQNKRIKKMWTWRKAMQTLQKLHQEKPIATIHSFWIGECSRIGQRFAEKNNVNHVVTVMGQDATVKNPYAKNLMRSAAHMVTLSKNHQAELYKTYRLESTMIPWHLDTHTFPELQEKTIDILAVGSLHTVKNYNDFIDVVSALAKKNNNLNTAIIGDGALRTDIQAKINQLELQNIITLHGKLPRRDVLECMAKSTILLHTSLYESFGFVFLEALYSGMHVVSYDVGLAEYSENWHVCDAKSDMIDVCEKLLLHKPTSLKRVEKGTETETINAYLSLYHA